MSQKQTLIESLESSIKIEQARLKAYESQKNFVTGLLAEATQKVIDEMTKQVEALESEKISFKGTDYPEISQNKMTYPYKDEVTLQSWRNTDTAKTEIEPSELIYLLYIYLNLSQVVVSR